MTDRERVITHLDDLRLFADITVHPVVSPDNWEVYSSLCDYIDQIKTEVDMLLKAHEPVKPIYNEEKYGDHLPHCGNCEKVLPDNAVYGKVNFCHYCGKAMK